jgi:hypothetical protein
MKCFNSVALPPTEKIKIIRIGIQMEGMLNQRSESVDLLAHIGVTGDQIDFTDTGEIP